MSETAFVISDRVESRDYQARIINKALDAVDDGHKSILIESATGSGKTIMALTIAQNLHERLGYNAGWGAMRRHLVHQAAEANDELIGFKNINFFSMFDKNPPEMEVLIEDEGHHSATESSANIFKTVQPKVHIALTATPFRTDRMKLCFSKVIKDAGIRSLIDQGWLSPYHHYTANTEWTPERVAHIYMSDPDRWGKSVVYFLTRVECEEFKHILNANGHKCEFVWANSDQEGQIQMFKDGEVPVLVNIVVLTEGFDAPDLNTVFVRPGTKGPTIQMAGRVLRKHDSKQHAQIVQSSDTKWPFLRTASSEAKWVLNDHGVWENRGVLGDKITAANIAGIKAIAKIDVSLPASFKKKKRAL